MAGASGKDGTVIAKGDGDRSGKASEGMEPMTVGTRSAGST